MRGENQIEGEMPNGRTFIIGEGWLEYGAHGGCGSVTIPLKDGALIEDLIQELTELGEVSEHTRRRSFAT